MNEKSQIELDEVQVLRDQVAGLSMRLAQSQQETTRHQAIGNQLLRRVTELMQENEALKKAHTSIGEEEK